MPTHAFRTRTALRRILRFALLPALLSALAMAAEDTAPEWLSQAARTPHENYGPKVDAVVLLDEGSTVVDGTGKKLRRLRFAVKALTDAGRSRARASVAYYMGSGKVKSLRAWLITPSGNVKSYDKKEIVDTTLGTGSVFEDIRARVADARMDALPGSVFGYESEEEDRSIFMQEHWQFQTLDPVILSRYTLEVPAGWRVESIARNYTGADAVVTGSAHRWELRNLKPIEIQEASPRLSSLAPYVAISYFAAGGSKRDSPEFSTWSEVAEWFTGLVEERSAADDAIRAKVAELTATARTPLQKAEAIGRYVQGVRYASIQLGIAKGGGYQPHPATEVFAKNYGDCKGKATLLKTMLREAGISAHTVSIYSGDPRRVNPDWPSPQQFNHAIVAIAVPQEADSPAAAEIEGLGRLLFFDPTDDDTPFGILPQHEQDSLVLIEAGKLGRLVKTPKALPATNHLHREVSAGLKADGSLEARIAEQSLGESATRQRRIYKGLAAADYRKHLDRWLGRRVPGLRIDNLELDPAFPGFQRQFAIAADSYGQRMGGGKLWVFRSSILDREADYELRDERRIHPFVLGAESFSERATFRLPEGYAVDELPDAVKLESPYGRYRASWNVNGAEMHFEQELTMDSAEIPAAEYPQLRDFLLKVRGASGASVVLARR